MMNFFNKKIFETHISDYEIENTYLRKLIAVVNFGMLEKGVNKINEPTYLKLKKKHSITKHDTVGKLASLGNLKKLNQLYPTR